jgi:dCTP deaminase
VILSDGSLHDAHSDGMLGITMLRTGAIQPASVDLHIGGQIKKQIKTGFAVGLKMKPEYDNFEIGGDPDGFYMYPGEFYLGHTSETVTIPDDCAGLLIGKSTWGRLGLSIHNQAGWIDPGFSGQITLEMKVDGVAPIRVDMGDAIAQLVVMQLDDEALSPYGPDRGNRYQGQTGATEPVMR